MSLKRKLNDTVEDILPKYEVVKGGFNSKCGLKLRLRRSLPDRQVLYFFLSSSNCGNMKSFFASKIVFFYENPISCKGVDYFDTSSTICSAPLLAPLKRCCLQEKSPQEQRQDKADPNPRPTSHIQPNKFSTPPPSNSLSTHQTEPALPAICKVTPVQRNSNFQVTKPNSSVTLNSTDHGDVTSNTSVMLLSDGVRCGSQYHVTRDNSKGSGFTCTTSPTFDPVNKTSNNSAGDRVREAVRDRAGERVDTSEVLTSNKTLSSDHQLFQYHMYRSIEKPVFESDVNILKSNLEYQELLQTYISLMGQHTQALRDLDQLENLRVSALRDPVKFIKKLQSGTLAFPCRQNVR